MFSKARPVIFGLLILFGLSFSPAPISFSHVSFAADADIRIELPADGQVRVQNDFGDVTAEVWRNNYVSVSADIQSNVSIRQGRSPILIDTKGSIVSISVVRTPVDPQATVNLRIKIPATARLAVTTKSGKIDLNGLSSSTILKSAGGAISSTFPPNSNADIKARTARGVIRAQVGKITYEGQSFDRRVGSGERVLDINSESGEIFVGYAVGLPVGAQIITEPALVAPTSGAAGIPASQPEGELDEGDVIRVDSQLVTLNMSVVDRGTSRGVIGLKQPDFRLFEDGQEQQVVQFDSSAAPFDLILLIDLSGSTKEKVELIRAAARRFVDAARPADRISVITFAWEPKIVSELTVDRQLLRERIATIETAPGDTKLYDAAEFAMNEVSKVPKRSRRTAIVLMSDGLDGTIPGVSGQFGSKRTYRELISGIQEFDGVLYTLWLNTRYVALNERDTQPEAFDEAHDQMKEMAEAGGGIFYEVKSIRDLAGAYEQVVADLGTVYSLSYRPSNSLRDGKWRAIRINVNRSNAVARGKRGYYAN